MKNIFAVFILFLTCAVRAETFKTFQNVLLPFSSDGCSSFPDHAFGVDWTQCCLKHDVSYWQGGTQKQRRQADEDLKRCVGKAASDILGKLMKWGVRPGGIPQGPTSWRWGYGWVLNRGYKSLSDLDRQQVEQQLALVDWDHLEILTTLPLQERWSLVGDYCIDDALFRISEEIGVDVLKYLITEDELKETPQGWVKTMSFLTPQCATPWVLKYLLLKKQACTTASYEITARDRIRWFDLDKPLDCF